MVRFGLVSVEVSVEVGEVELGEGGEKGLLVLVLPRHETLGQLHENISLTVGTLGLALDESDAFESIGECVGVRDDVAHDRHRNFKARRLPDGIVSAIKDRADGELHCTASRSRKLDNARFDANAVVTHILDERVTSANFRALNGLCE